MKSILSYYIIIQNFIIFCVIQNFFSQLLLSHISTCSFIYINDDDDDDDDGDDDRHQ